jgi:hypothetical protein
MRKLLALAIAAGLLQGVNAQKVDLDRYWYTTSNRSLPTNPLPSGSRTYRIEVTNSSIISSIYSNEGLKGALAIDGFKNTEPKAHLNISLFFSDLNFEKTGVNERKEDIKDKAGKVTGQKSYYSAWGQYRFGIDVYVKDSNLAVIDRYQPYSTNNVLTYNTNEFASYNEAANYFNNNVGDIKRNLAKSHTDNALVTMRNSLKAKYGYPVNSYRDFLWVLDSKKHDEYKHHQEMWDLFKSTTVKFNGAENVSESLKNELKPVMSYFDSLRVRFASDDKADKKFRHCSYYTMAKIYLLLDNPEAALKEADLLVTNGFDVKDADLLKREANTMIDRFKKNGVNSTHFPLDPGANAAPR